MATNVLPPDIDEITGSEDWKSFTPDQRNALVDDWALQARNAYDWTPEELKELDSSVDSFRQSALESFGEQAGRIVKEGVVGGAKSLAALPLAVPKLGLQSGKIIGYGGDPEASTRELFRDAPELARAGITAEQTLGGLDTLRRKYDPFSDTDEKWEQEFDTLRQDVLDRKLSDNPDELYDYLKKKAFRIAKENARFYGGDEMDYMPQEFQGGNDEEIFKRYFNEALSGKRPEGFIEFRDDTLPQQGLVTKNQSRSLITSPENLGLLMKFSATRNPMYFEALKQRLGRSRDRQVSDAILEDIEDKRGEGDFFDDAAQTIFSVGGLAPEAGEAMKEEVRGLASSPVDIASTLFSFGLGKQAVKQAVERNLLKAAGSVAAGAGTEFIEGALSGVADQPIPELGNLAEQGLMEAVGGGVMQATGGAVQGIQELRNPRVAEEILRETEVPEVQPEGAPLLTPEEQEAFAEAEEVRVMADEAEPLAPAVAEALREEADLIEIEATEIPATETDEGTVIDTEAGGGVEADALAPEVQELAPAGVEQAGGAPIAPETQPVTPEGEVVVQEAGVAPAGEAIPSRSVPTGASVSPTASPPAPVQQAVESISNWATQFGEQGDETRKARVQSFVNTVLPALGQYGGLFRDVRVDPSMSTSVRVGENSRSLQINPARLFDDLSYSETPQAARKAFETVLDEEFRHTVSLELDQTSPEFSKDLGDLWSQLPADVKQLSAEVYNKETGTQFDSDWRAKHEFFRQYWQNAEVRKITEQTLGSQGLLDSLRKMLDTFIAQLKRLRDGAVPEVKPILDRLIAQAQQRADEIRQRAKTPSQPTNAVQIQESENVDARQQAPDGEAVGKGDTQRQETARESSPEPEEEVTSLKKRVRDKERADRNAPEIGPPEKRGRDVLFEEASDVLAKNPQAGFDLITELKASPRVLTDTEVVEMLLHKAELINLRNQAAKAVEEAAKTGDEAKVAAAKAIYDKYQSAINDVDILSGAGGGAATLASRSLNAYKIEVALRKQDISTEGLMDRFRVEVNLGKPLTEDQKALVKKNAEALQKAQKEIDDAKTALEKDVAAPVEKKLALEARREKLASSESLKATRKKRFKEAEKGARERLKARKEEKKTQEPVSVQTPSAEAPPAPVKELPKITLKPLTEEQKAKLAAADKSKGTGPIRTQEAPKQEFTKTTASDLIKKVRSFYDKINEVAGKEIVSEVDEQSIGGDTVEESIASLLGSLDVEVFDGPWNSFAKDIGLPHNEVLRLLKSALTRLESGTPDYVVANEISDLIARVPRFVEALRKLSADQLDQLKKSGSKVAYKKAADFYETEAPKILGAFRDYILSKNEKGLEAPSAQDQDFEDYAIIGASYIEDGATSLEAFTKKLTDEFGQKVGNQAEAIYNRSQKIHSDFVEAIQKEKEKAEQANSPSAVLKAGEERLKDKDKSTIDRELAAKLFKAHVRAKASATPEQVNTAVLNDLKGLYPAATESDVRVAITDYGKAKWPSKDALKKREAEYRRILRLVESLERIQSGKQALKSGLQREKPSARERELTAEIKEAMKKFKVETTAEDQLASAKKAITNRLKNQIEDLNRIIEGKQKPKEARAQVEYDAEMNALVKERDSLKAYVDDLTGPSKEGKWNQKAQAAAKAMAENYRRRIAQADFAARSKPNYNPTEATRKLQEEAESAKAEFQTLKDLSGETQKEQIERQKNTLEKEIKKVTDQIATGARPVAGKPKPTNAEIADLKSHLKILKETRAYLDGDGKRAKAAEKSLERTITELQRKIKEKDLKPAERRTPVDNERLRELRQERDFWKEVLAGVKEAAEPRRTPEEIALRNFQRRVEKLRYDAENGIKRVEYLEPEPDDRIKEVKKRAEKARYALEEAKIAWNTEIVEKKMKNLKPLDKILSRTSDVFNLARAIQTSIDLSSVLRQGAPLTFAHPKLALENFAPMIRAFFSKEFQSKAAEAMRKDPKYALAKSAGLYLADMNTTDLSAVEENFKSRLVEKIPRVLGGGLVRGSQRAYTQFLNAMRLSVFNSLVDTMGRDGKVTMEEAKSLASFINVASGRGIIGSSKQPSGNSALAAAFFSPRLVASRFNLLFGQPLYGGNLRTRKAIAKEYVKFVTGLGIALGFLALMKRDDDEEPFLVTDARSSDFMKPRFGNTRIDLFGGLLQTLAIAYRTAVGETIVKGEARPTRDILRPLEAIRELTGQELLGDREYSDPTGLSVAGNFVRSKFSPVVGAIANLMMGKDYIGEDTSVSKEALRLITPMSGGSVKDVFAEQDPARALLFTLFSILGAGVNTYKPKED